MQEPTINLKHYVSVITYLAFKSSKIVKECAQNPDLKKYDKGINDPVTDADYKIQTFIIKGLTHFFPKLRIVGQETTDYKGPIQLNLQQITLNNYPQTSKIQQSVPIDELCVWIDPIDNTKGFIQGTLESVTILIGLARKNRSYLGIVTTPYAIEQNQRIYRPRVNIGNVSSKESYVAYEIGKWTRLQKPQLQKPLRILASDRRINECIEQITKKYDAKLLKMGGSGSKFNKIIFGEADIVIYLGYGNCRWDSCASSAIILALGGCFTDQYGKEINYDADAKTFHNNQGNVCVLDQDLHKHIIGDIAAFSGNKAGLL